MENWYICSPRHRLVSASAYMKNFANILDNFKIIGQNSKHLFASFPHNKTYTDKYILIILKLPVLLSPVATSAI